MHKLLLFLFSREGKSQRYFVPAGRPRKQLHLCQGRREGQAEIGCAALSLGPAGRAICAPGAQLVAEFAAPTHRLACQNGRPHVRTKARIVSRLFSPVDGKASISGCFRMLLDAF